MISFITISSSFCNLPRIGVRIRMFHIFRFGRSVWEGIVVVVVSIVVRRSVARFAFFSGIVIDFCIFSFDKRLKKIIYSKSTHFIKKWQRKLLALYNLKNEYTNKTYDLDIHLVNECHLEHESADDGHVRGLELLPERLLLGLRRRRSRVLTGSSKLKNLVTYSQQEPNDR
jgi:hypothetical protein